MANKKTVALTETQYKEIIDTMFSGASMGFRDNRQIASVLMIEANLGLRLSDIVPYQNKATGKASPGLKLSDIKEDGGRLHLDIVEQKTGKQRTFTVHPAIYSFLQDYCIDNGIKKDQPMFPISERRVQKYLQTVCDFLDGQDGISYQGISTHSFRKYFATSLYNESGHNPSLVQKALQHSSLNTTQRYIGVSDQDVEDAIGKHLCLIKPEDTEE